MSIEIMGTTAHGPKNQEMETDSNASSVTERRPVGRPARGPQRREEILTAVERCIIERGVHATTFKAVAETAGLKRSLVHHYIKNRNELIQAAVERAVSNVESAVLNEMQEAVESGVDAEAMVDLMLNPRMQAPAVSALIDELYIAALRDSQLRELVAAMYESFVTSLESALAQISPASNPERRRTAATALVGLIDATLRFQQLGHDPTTIARMRRVAVDLAKNL